MSDERGPSEDDFLARASGKQPVLLGLLVMLGGTAAAPFIYTLF